MAKFHAIVNVYFSKQVDIEINADNEDDAIEGINLGDYDDHINKALQGDDFRVELGYADDYKLDTLEESKDENIL